jgi:hypothetical protein
MTTPDDLSNELDACMFCGEDLAAFTEEPERHNACKAVVMVTTVALCPQCAAIRVWMSSNEMEILKESLHEIRIRRGSMNTSVVAARLAESMTQGDDDGIQ